MTVVNEIGSSFSVSDRSVAVMDQSAINNRTDVNHDPVYIFLRLVDQIGVAMLCLRPTSNPGRAMLCGVLRRIGLLFATWLAISLNMEIYCLS